MFLLATLTNAAMEVLSTVTQGIEMYVLIDRDAPVFRHAHPDHSVISGLAHIEVAHCAVAIYDVHGDHDFISFTDLELKLLYQNTTGQKFEGYSRPHLSKAILALARTLPASDVNAFEVEQQARKITMEDSGFYRYAKGAYKAARTQELFLPPALTAPVPAEGAAPAPGPDQRVAPTVAPAKVPAAPKGGNRATIFAVADSMWEQAGSPKDASTVLTLRKTIMAALESEHGIKKTTSSTALGDWQKVRLNS